MVEWIQLSSVRFRFVLVFLLSLTMVLGSSQATEIECPSGFIYIVTATHNSTIQIYQREAGTDSNYNPKSSDGYCNAKITIDICIIASCRRGTVDTTINFNLKGNEMKDDNIHFNPTSNQLEVSFGFKALGSYVDQIEEAAKNSTDADTKLTAGKLVEQLRFVKNKGFTLDPPRSREGDWNYVPNLLAPPRTTTTVATSKASTTASSSSSSTTNTTNKPTTTKPKDKEAKCDCNKAPLRLLFFRAPESDPSAAAPGANSKDSGQQNQLGDKEIGYIIGMVVMGVIAIGFFISTVILGIKLRNMKKSEEELNLVRTKAEAAVEQDVKEGFQNVVAVEHISQRDVYKAYSELRLIDQIQQEINDLQPDQSNIDRFRELEKRISTVIGLLDNIKYSFLKLRNYNQRRIHDDIIDRLESDDAVDIVMVDRSENEVGSALLKTKLRQRKEEAEDKGKLDQKTKLEAEKSTKEQGSGQNKNQSDIAKDGMNAKNAKDFKDVNDAKGENGQKPKNKGEAANKNKTEDAPK